MTFRGESMSSVDRVQLPIEDRDGVIRGHVIIQLLPNSPATVPGPLLERSEPERDSPLPNVQLLEGSEYLYEVKLASTDETDTGPVTTNRPEIFHPSTTEGLDGRLRPGLYTGTLPVDIFAGGEFVGTIVVEVRSRKLDYLTHYEWMLSDLADTFAELIMRSFAPTETRFAPQSDADAPTLYQRFAFLKSMLSGDVFDGAIQEVLHNPHRQWEEEQQRRPVGQSIPSGPMVARALARGGRRVTWDGGPLQETFRGTAVRSLPIHIPVTRTHETEDTMPNRFIKYALTRWRDTVAEIATALDDVADGPAADRGRTEAAYVLMQLDELLAQPLFRGIGPLTHLPADNQVLQKRAGYRELYRLYVQFELAAMLAWSGGDDVYGAGKKDVAVLYEYWVFLQLAQAISTMCDQPLPLEQLLQVDRGGLNIRLRQGQRRVLVGSVRRLGRGLGIELWFNRTFRRSAGENGSWSQTLRPDCSLRITIPGYNERQDEIWLHFDAKYRLDSLGEVFAPAADEEEAFDELTTTERIARPLTEDLLKMHAYRDAIRRSSGAFVVYPGSEMELRRRYHEILPGLGAFALVPSDEAQAQGISAIRDFIDDVFDHAALQITQHERHRFWERKVHRAQPPAATAGEVVMPEDSQRTSATDSSIVPAYRSGAVEAVSFLSRPPADTVVLLGYVKDLAHYHWIRQEGLYNVRADERSGTVGLRSEQLAAEFVMLYGPPIETAELWAVNDDPRIMSRQRLLAVGYPSPGGELYYCLPIDPTITDNNPLRLTYAAVVDTIATMFPDSPYGGPVAMTWLQLVQCSDGL